MNILFLEMELAPHLGGVQRVSYILANELAQKENINTFFVFTAGDTDAISSERKLKVDINQKEQYRECLFRFVKDKSIDVVVCQNPYLLYLPQVYQELKEKYGVKFICVFHANPERYSVSYSFNRYFKKLYIKEVLRKYLGRVLHSMYIKKIQQMYHVSDAFVLLSSTYIDTFKRIYKVQDTENKLMAIYNPSSCVTTDTTVMKENTLLIVGRMEESQKRISLALNVWEKLSKELEDWTCCVVGDGPHLNVYKQIVQDKNLKNIQFIGHSNEVQKYFLKSKLFLMTSTWEGLPMVLIEALNSECVPVAVNSFSSLTDVIDNEYNGIIVKNSKVDTIVNEIKKLVNSDKIQIMAGNSKKSIENKFSVETITNKWIELFQNLIEK